MNETFKSVPGYPHYRVSDHGRVQSCRKRGGRPCDWYDMRLLKLKSGYIYIRLANGQKPRFYYVHRLVLELFVSPPPIGTEGCHQDGNRSNNHIGNLRWDTRKANIADAVRHGTWIRGERRSTARLTEQKVREIRQLRREEGLLELELAARFKVSKTLIHLILNRKRWAHIS